MKTADLIPFILLELNEADKYGFELTKAIENKSNGKIVIKQPTLYTLLKKLEKSKFIASYWEDSEIGGKRHYYKLTQNGKLQVSTLPSYEFLMNNALAEDEDTDINEEKEMAEDTIETKKVEAVQKTEDLEEKKASFMDELLSSTPAESILPTEEVFTEENIDSSTELDINLANADVLKQEQLSTDEQFATNENVSRFTEKVTTTPTNVNETVTLNNNSSILDIEYTIPKNDIDIEYVDYVDYKNTDSYKKSKTLTRKMLYQSLSTSLSLIVIAILCSLVTSFTGRSGLYYFFLIASLVTALFYPIIVAINLDKLRQVYQKKEYSTKTKLKLYMGLTLALAILVICVIVNINVGKNSIGLILGFKNFANLYAPILFTLVYFLDVLYNYIFCSKLNK